MEIQKLGPSGSSEENWIDIANPEEIRRIIKIIIYHSKAIHGLCAVYERRGIGMSKHHFEGSNGGKMSKINLAANEYIVSLRGSCDTLDGLSNAPPVVTYLEFETNKGARKAYGEKRGHTFEYQADGKIIGFHGKCGDYLEKIGVYFKVNNVNATTSGNSGELLTTDSTDKHIYNSSVTNNRTTAGNNTGGHLYSSSTVLARTTAGDNTGGHLYSSSTVHARTTAGHNTGGHLYSSSTVHKRTTTGGNTGEVVYKSSAVNKRTTSGSNTGGHIYNGSAANNDNTAAE